MLPLSQCTSLFDRASARYLDKNGNGRLEGTELFNAERNALRNIQLAAELKGAAVSEANIHELAATTPNVMRKKLLHFQEDYSGYFPGGIELPTAQQVGILSSEAHETAKNIIDARTANPIIRSLGAAAVALSNRVQFDLDFGLSTVSELVAPGGYCSTHPRGPGKAH